MADIRQSSRKAPTFGDTAGPATQDLGEAILTTRPRIFTNLEAGGGTLYSLPQELVERIYENVFTEEDIPSTETLQCSEKRLTGRYQVVLPGDNGTYPRKTYPFILTSKRIQSDALPIYYRLRLVSYQIPFNQDWTGQLLQTQDIQMMQKIELHLNTKSRLDGQWTSRETGIVDRCTELVVNNFAGTAIRRKYFCLRVWLPNDDVTLYLCKTLFKAMRLLTGFELVAVELMSGKLWDPDCVHNGKNEVRDWAEPTLGPASISSMDEYSIRIEFRPLDFAAGSSRATAGTV